MGCVYTIFRIIIIIVIIINIIIFVIIILSATFSYQYSLIGFHWSLKDCKSPQVSRTLLRILPDPNNAVDWMVSIRLPISSFYHPLFWTFEGRSKRFN